MKEYNVEYIRYDEKTTIGYWRINGVEMEFHKVRKSMKSNFIKSLKMLDNKLSQREPIVDVVEMMGVTQTVSIITNLFLVKFLEFIELYLKDRLKKSEEVSIETCLNNIMGKTVNNKFNKTILGYYPNLRDYILGWITTGKIEQLDMKKYMEQGKPMVLIVDTLGFQLVMSALKNYYIDYLPKYIDSFYESMYRNRILPVCSHFYAWFSGIRIAQPLVKDNSIRDFIKEICDEMYLKYGNMLIKTNFDELDLNKDRWTIYQRSEYQMFTTASIDFSHIEGEKFKKELKWYYKDRTKDMLISNRDIHDVYIYFKTLVKVVNFLYSELEIDCFAEIDTFYAQSIKRYLTCNVYKENEDKLISPATAAKVIARLRDITQFLIEKKVSTRNHSIPIANSFLNIKMHNIGKMGKTMDVIPDVIMDKLEEYKYLLPDEQQRIFDIFNGTGMRLKEILFLEKDCLDYTYINDKDENKRGVILKYVPYKILKTQKKIRSCDRHEIYISEFLAEIIEKQIDISANLRNKKNVPYIFIGDSSGFVRVKGRSITRNIKKIIKDNNICDIDGEVWNFDARQFRATVAANMIENEATEAEIMQQLNHIEPNTTRKYYEKVKKLKLAQLNEKFFEKEFEVKIGKEQLELYTEEERKLLYVDFELSEREVLFGKCTKHFSQGRCNNAGEDACANCSKLCTGKKYLPRWMELLQKQEDIIKALEVGYSRESIPPSEYSNFIEYIREVNQANYLKEVINSINGG